MTSSRSDTRLVTFNRFGRTTDAPTETSEAFIDFVNSSEGVAVDIGCAFGVTTIPAGLGKALVVGVDVSHEHTRILMAEASRSPHTRVAACVGRFPGSPQFASDSLVAVHAANLLNFLTGVEIANGLRSCFDWLQPRGRIFTISGTPFVSNQKRFLPVYQGRRKRGISWPGEVENPQRYGDHETIRELPSFIHLLDSHALIPAFENAGFRVIVAREFARARLPTHLSFDGRENVEVIAVKD